MTRLRARLGISIPLTFKAEESLVRALTLARDNDLYCNGDTILWGLLEARSAAIPVLDTLGVSLPKLSSQMKHSALQFFDSVLRLQNQHHFTNEFKDLTKEVSDSYPQRTLDVATRIALNEGMKAVDSATILRAILQEDLNELANPSEEELNRYARTPLSRQMLERADERYGDPEDYSTWFQHFADWLPDIHSFARFEDSIRLARTVEPFLEVPKLIALPTSRGWRVRNFDFLNLYRVEEAGERERAALAKISVVAGPGVVTWDAIEELEQLLGKDSTSESDFQKFFERNPRFLLGDNYCHLHSQIVLLSEDGDLIPDFFVERPGTRFADILELKKPGAKIVSGSGRRRGFSAELTQALNQVREYRNFFENKATREEFYRRYGFRAYRPSVCIVIGRSWEYVDHMERIQIEDEYKNVRVLTYDDILARAKSLALL
jgi:hypothetical protein